MAIFKRGRIYWYKFMFNGEAIRESTRQTNQVVARNMESAHRTSLAKGEVGLRDKRVVPTLVSFCEERVEPWAESTFKHASRKTWLWYKFGIDSLKNSATLSNFKLNEIGAERSAEPRPGTLPKPTTAAVRWRQGQAASSRSRSSR